VQIHIYLFDPMNQQFTWADMKTWRSHCTCLHMVAFLFIYQVLS